MLSPGVPNPNVFIRRSLWRDVYLQDIRRSRLHWLPDPIVKSSTVRSVLIKELELGTGLKSTFWGIHGSLYTLVLDPFPMSLQAPFFRVTLQAWRSFQTKVFLIDLEFGYKKLPYFFVSIDEARLLLSCVKTQAILEVIALFWSEAFLNPNPPLF